MIKARSLFAAAAVLSTAAFASAHDDAPRKWAVLVGVADYRNYGAEEGGDLAGASNDARNMREVLVARWGFAPENVRMLTDTAATRDAVRSALTEWLPSVARPGDVVVFFFSGHGSQVLDADGDEPDGLDETLCPTDVMRNDGSRDIKDDELAGWLAALPTREVTVILDSCHSGTATRSIAPFARRKALSRSGPAPAPANPAPTRSDSAPGVLEISAAQADQYALETSWEEGGTTHHGGAFTTPLVRYLWQVPTGTPYAEIFRMTREDMRRANLAQTPRIAEVPARTRAAFASAPEALANAAQTRSVRVTEADSRGVTLQGGAWAGVRPGALFRSGGAVLRVTEVRDDRATASLVSGPMPAVGAEAQLVAVQPGAAVLRVTVAGLPAQTIRDLQGRQVPGLALQSNPNTPAQLIVRTEGAQVVVTGADGDERARVPAADPGALASLLRNEAAAYALATLENPAHPWPVDFGFAQARNRFRLGEQVAFRVKSVRTGYLTVVDVAPGGAVTVVFPNEYDRNNRIEGGQEITLPTQSMPFEFRVEEPLGRGVVRAFVTERPLELSTRDGGDTVAGLLAALRAAEGASMSDLTVLPVEHWATSYVVYDFTR
jgi:hypothetical protein